MKGQIASGDAHPCLALFGFLWYKLFMRELPLYLKLLESEARQLSLRESLKMRQHQPVLERVAKTAVARTVGCSCVQTVASKYVAKYSNNLIRGHGSLRYLGSGWEQVVFEDSLSDEVVKLLLRSGHISLKKRDADVVAEELVDIDRQCAEVAPSIWLPSQMSTVEVGSKKKIILRQPRMRSALPRGTYSLDIMKDNAISPELKRRFAQGVLNIIEKVGVVPDLAGPDNVMYGDHPGLDEGIVIVDTIPLVPGNGDSLKGRKEYDLAMEVIEAGSI